MPKHQWVFFFCQYIVHRNIYFMQSHRLKFNADFSVFYVAIVAFSVIFSIFMRIVSHARTHEFLLYNIMSKYRSVKT